MCMQRGWLQQWEQLLWRPVSCCVDYLRTHTQSNTAQGIAATTAEKMLDAGCPICIRAPAQALCAAQGIIMTSVMTCARQKFSRPGWQSQCSGQSCRLQRLTRSQRGGQEREREGEREDRRARCENICALLAYGCQCDWIGPGCSSSMSLAEPCHYRYSLDPGS